MSTTTYPVRVDATPDPGLNRWLWLVKWILALPHYVVLVFLWLAFFVLSIVAFSAVAFTGHYPRQIFEFNVGVLRWNWRVAYYAYGALATDRYPPFTLADVPDYPAHLEIAYPERLSRGLVLVKWWLLALPHYVIVGIFVGGSVYVANEATSGEQAPWMWGGGLIGVLVLVAGVVLLFTGRYPSSIFDLVLGLNRWVLRVAAYAGLMTDDYPPFRLDMGGADPASPVAITAYVAADPAQPPVHPAPVHPAPAASPTPPSTWSAGRVVTMVLGCLALAVAGGLLAGGATLAVLQGTFQDDDGFLMSADEELTTSTYALTSVNLETKIGDGAGVVPDRLLGESKVRVAAVGGDPIFVGIGPTDEVESYLAGVGHTVVVDFDTSGTGGTPVYEDASGGAPAAEPAEALRWSAQSSGSGTQDLGWSVQDGDWTVVVMNADGSADVAVDMSVGAELPALWWVVAALSILGACLLLLSAVLIRAALRVKTAATS